MKKILDLIPVPYTEAIRNTIEDRKILVKALAEKTNNFFNLDILFIDKGSTSIESYYDDALNTPYILEKIQSVEKNYDAIVIDCFADPALESARELTKIPIIGVNEASTHLAAQICTRFSIVNVLPEVEDLLRKIVAKNGILPSLASIVTINIPVLALEKDKNVTIEKMVTKIEKAVAQDGAEAIVFGCTAMFSVINEVKMRLNKDGINIPIIEPLTVGVFTAASWVMMDISQSKLAFATPRVKERIK
jgi:allantoin racemase